MKRLLATLTILLTFGTLTATSQAQDSRESTTITPPTQNLSLLRTMRNAKFIYVTSNDGSQFEPSTLPADQKAIAAVQDEIQDWGYYTVVYSPHQADMIVVVQSRPSGDLLSVYDAKGSTATWLWRAEQKNGLSMPDMPLLRQFHAALERATS
jgi:hypothetical protein